MTAKGKAQVIFRVVIGLAFVYMGVSNLMNSGGLLGSISVGAGIAFFASLFIRKNGEKK